MKFEKPVNPNYCGTVVEIKELRPLDGCDNVVAAIIFGNQVIVSKSTAVGTKGVFFPVETSLSKEFLHKNNLYRDDTLNDEPIKGYFEKSGRVRAVKFRGHKSEGFFIELKAFKTWADEDQFSIGQDFDKIGNQMICCKYVVPVKNSGGRNYQPHKKVRRSRLVEDQFRLHIDTVQLRKNVSEIKPTDTISITNKIHGTSWIVGNVLTKRKLNIFEKFLKFLGICIADTIYDIIYSSRGVIKNQWDDDAENVKNLGFYKYDLWKDIKDRVQEFIPKGMTLYGEAVGQLPTGAWIQQGYHYGARPGTFNIYIYRATMTNVDGKVTELSDPQLKQFCAKYGLNYKQEFYYGLAKDFIPEVNVTDHWHEAFLKKLEDTFILERMCPLNNEEVPEEGIVVRVEDFYEFKAFKLKNFRFLAAETKALDAGVNDIETEQSTSEEEVKSE